MKQTKWKIMLFAGTLPFLWAIVQGLYAAVNGFSGLSITSAPVYGFQAFADYLILYSFVFWPTYLVGLILIGWAVWKLRSKIK